MTSSSARYEFTATPDLDLETVVALYDSVGWSAYTRRPDIFLQMLSGASHVIAVHDAGTLVGLARVVGDGVSVAVIQDLIVHPGHQRRGLGRELLRRVLDVTRDVRQTYITTDAAVDNRHVVRLYEEHGFTHLEDEGLVTLALLRQTLPTGAKAVS